MTNEIMWVWILNVLWAQGCRHGRLTKNLCLDHWLTTRLSDRWWSSISSWCSIGAPFEQRSMQGLLLQTKLVASYPLGHLAANLSPLSCWHPHGLDHQWLHENCSAMLQLRSPTFNSIMKIPQMQDRSINVMLHFGFSTPMPMCGMKLPSFLQGLYRTRWLPTSRLAPMVLPQHWCNLPFAKVSDCNENIPSKTLKHYNTTFEVYT